MKEKNKQYFKKGFIRKGGGREKIERVSLGENSFNPKDVRE